MTRKLDIAEENSNELCLHLNLSTFDDALLLDLGCLARHQISDQECKNLNNARKGKQGKGLALGETTIRGAKLKTRDGKVFVSNPSRRDLVDWCHEILQRRGFDGALKTMIQEFKWPKMSAQVMKQIKGREKCQECKITGQKKHGKIPLIAGCENIQP